MCIYCLFAIGVFPLIDVARVAFRAHVFPQNNCFLPLHTGVCSVCMMCLCVNHPWLCWPPPRHMRNSNSRFTHTYTQCLLWFKCTLILSKTNTNNPYNTAKTKCVAVYADGREQRLRFACNKQFTTFIHLGAFYIPSLRFGCFFFWCASLYVCVCVFVPDLRVCVCVSVYVDSQFQSHNS